MIRVELKDLQENLDYYFDKLEEGESIEVLENGKIIYTLTEPFERASSQPKSRTSKKAGKRVLGQHKGVNIPKHFFEPLPLETFLGKSPLSKVKQK